MSWLSKAWSGVKKVVTQPGRALKAALPAVAAGALAIPGIGPVVSGAVGAIGSALGGLQGRVDNSQRIASDAVGGLAVAVRDGRQEARESSGFTATERAAGAAINAGSGVNLTNVAIGGLAAFAGWKILTK